MLHVAFDDTDSREGGCTTSLAQSVAALFPELTLAGAPRLVRLNPNVPWKTRGNGAVALTFDGDLGLDEALARAYDHILRNAQTDANTSPGVVVSAERLPEPLYHAAVTRIVERTEVEKVLSAHDARSAGGRGVIGAAAALAWPMSRTTWELIAYRERDRIGTPRRLDAHTFRAIETREPTTFDTFDIVNEEVVCVPASPCPVLYGLRGTDPSVLSRLASTVGPEPAARATLFLTNHGSDDHIVDRRVEDCRPYESARVSGRVAERPTERGGHVFFEVVDETGRLRCAAYAPTRAFRTTAMALREGDTLVVCGGLHAGPDGRLTLGLEKLRLDHAAPRKSANPACPSCGKNMKSAGRDAGWRCRGCGTNAQHAVTRAAALRLGWHEVPARARRHLARPLRLDSPPVNQN